MLWTERRKAAAQLKDSRSNPAKVAGGGRKPKALDPPSSIDVEIARLEKAKQDRKLAKMDPESRRLEILKEMRDREPVEPGKPHPRLAKIEEIMDSIVANPEREFEAYENALLTYQQHGEGMDPAEADRLWAALREQETAYLQGVRNGHLEKQAALTAELSKVNAALGNFQETPPPNTFAALQAIPQHGRAYGIGLTPEEYQAVESAAGNPEAEAAVSQQLVAKATAYLQAVTAEA